MICESCGKDVMSYTAMGISGPVPHNCPADLVPVRRDELAALRRVAVAAKAAMPWWEAYKDTWDQVMELDLALEALAPPPNSDGVKDGDG